ncbi:MAG: YicC family protein [Spirochaetales bacterium]|nr:YicC family protein [Spirochaetales bacterium]
MKSMTGFAFREHLDDKVHFVINLKSYNNRFLDIVIYLPPYLNPLEPKLREMISTHIQRGRVELAIKVKELEEEIDIHLDEKAARSYARSLKELIKVTGVKSRIGLSHLLRLEGVLKPIKNYDYEAYWNKLKPILEKSFEEYEESRLVEGKRTGDAITAVLNIIENNVKIIESFVPEIEIKVKETLKKRFSELLGDQQDEARVYSETAVMLIKFDIQEEVVRLKSHLMSFKDVLKDDKPMGKKLDFLCQELNREINTIGSKSILLEVNNAVISVKDAIETVREQLRNVE